MVPPVPRHSNLYPGCLLAVLVNAVKTMQTGMISFNQWDDDTYLYDGVDGTFAAITFKAGSLVGTVYDKDSERNPFRRGTAYDPRQLFQGIPAGHAPLLERALSYWRAEVDGKVVPLVSAGFWDGDEYLSAAEPWSEVWNNGAWVLERQLMDDWEAALIEWQRAEQFSSAQAELIGSLLQRKLAQPDTMIEVTLDELRVLLTRTEDPVTRLLHTFQSWREATGEPGALDASRQVLATLSIRLPDTESRS